MEKPYRSPGGSYFRNISAGISGRLPVNAVDGGARFGYHRQEHPVYCGGRRICVYQAVIFDMDGVLTDSESLGVRVIRQAGSEMGYDIPEELVLSTLGRTFDDSRQLYLRVFPDMDVRALFDRFGEMMISLAREGRVPLKPGVHEILDTLDALDIRRAVASSSGPNAINAYLAGAGILDRFDAVVSGRDCRRSKPAPDIFLLAAERLQADPSRCLVIEDSPSGVRAGRAAGMTVCMVPDLIPFEESLAPCCDFVLPGLSAAAERLRHG